MSAHRHFPPLFWLAPDEEARLSSAAFGPERADGGRVVTLKTVETWFDTSEGGLRAAGLALSLIVSGRSARQRARLWPDVPVDDWRDQALSAAHPVISALPSEFLKRAPEGLNADSLVDVFQIAGVRRERLFTIGGSSVSLSIDGAAIAAGNQQRRFHTARFELVKGRPSALFALIRTLPADIRLRPRFYRPAERGFLSRDGEWGLPQGKITAIIDADMTAAEAFEEIAWACLRHFSLNERAYGGPERVEAVHQMRVAIRRLRAALSLFAPFLRDAAFETLRGEFKWLFARLGDVRDIDVILEHLNEPGAPGAILANIDLPALQARRDEAAASLAVALESPRLDRVLLDFAEWLAAGAWRRAADPRQTRERGRVIGQFAAKRLDRRQHTIAGMAVRFDSLSVQELHALRIEAKTLRYMSEFLQALASRGKSRLRYTAAARALSALQDTLGLVHDIDARGEALSLEPAPARADASVCVIPLSGDERKLLLKRARREAKAVASAKPFWRAL